ncbi:hypothetical protein M9H77_12060 [Catharanthus roseus]|uniref:Uncharacterized protein n=1 Tax=Catharanthus roseus TaxID=4058 RepID=A0ACC0BGF7_CATRO|nr:hypothetical protein M9H77_12060 [Catharanthus roseus]
MACISNLPYVEGSSTNRSPLFNGTNYTFWKSMIKIYICYINFDLWSIVEKGPFVPQMDGRVKKKGFNKRGKKPSFKKGGQSSSLFKARCFEFNSTDHFVADCPKAIEKEKGALEAKLEDFSNKDFQELVLEKKNLCEVLSLEKCMVDYDDLKKKVNDLTMCIEKFTKGKENFEKPLGSQRSSFDKNVNVKNVNVGRRENYKERGISRGGRKGKLKKLASNLRLPERFISFKAAANFEEWTRKRRKIALGHRVDLSDMGGMEIISNLFENIGWRPLFIVNELYHPEMIYKFYANLHKGRVKNLEILLINGLLLGWMVEIYLLMTEF